MSVLGVFVALFCGASVAHLAFMRWWFEPLAAERWRLRGVIFQECNWLNAQAFTERCDQLLKELESK